VLLVNVVFITKDLLTRIAFKGQEIYRNRKKNESPKVIQSSKRQTNQA
jgi:hypothetical protein